MSTSDFSERHLQCAWYDPDLRPPRLQTPTGEQVVVDDPGRWNLEAGPDFLDAVLRIGPDNRRVTGDVEIHVHERDWHVHNHAADPRYARVAFHVFYHSSPSMEDSRRFRGIRIEMGRPLREDPTFSFDAIDIGAYPYAAPAHSFTPCARILARRSNAQKTELLRSAGHERLRRKTSRLHALLRDAPPEQVFYGEVMSSLGYRRNRTAFWRVAEQMPVAMLRELSGGDPIKALAILLGTAGLLPAKASISWDEETRDFVRRLWDAWWKVSGILQNRALPASIWNQAGLRPQNHPIRRMAAAASLFALGRHLDVALRELRRDDASRWFREAQHLISRRATMPYWTYRFSFSGKKQKNPSALVGPRRLAAILSNIAVPFLAATGTDIAHLLESLPTEHDNALIRETAARLFGPDHNPALYGKGLLQQGLLQVFHDFCVDSEITCARCPLAQSLKGRVDEKDKR